LTTKPSDRAFTLLEMLVAMAVGLPVLLAALAFFRGQSEAYARGEKRMEVAREVATVTRVLYSELKAIHSPMVLDERYDLWVAGEADGRFLSNRVLIEGGGRTLRYWAYPLESPGTRQERRLDFRDGGLVVTESGRQHPIGRRVTAGRFEPVRGNSAAVQVEFTVEVPAAPGGQAVTDHARLQVELEGELNAVR
jgi:prepilin-type N-terminal cleavage/methylation domain-containing protein